MNLSNSKFLTAFKSR